MGKLIVLKSIMSPGNPAWALYFVGVQLTQLARLEMKHSEDLLDILQNRTKPLTLGVPSFDALIRGVPPLGVFSLGVSASFRS